MNINNFSKDCFDLETVMQEVRQKTPNMEILQDVFPGICMRIEIFGKRSSHRQTDSHFEVADSIINSAKKLLDGKYQHSKFAYYEEHLLDLKWQYKRL